MNNKWKTHTHSQWMDCPLLVVSISRQWLTNQFFRTILRVFGINQTQASPSIIVGGTHAAHLVVSFISRQVAIARRAKSKMASSKQSNQASGHHQTAARYTGTNKEKRKKKSFEIEFFSSVCWLLAWRPHLTLLFEFFFLRRVIRFWRICF